MPAASPSPKQDSEPPGGSSALRSGIREKPLLASEALVDDVAPREPQASSARHLCSAVAIAFAAAAALSRALPDTHVSLAGTAQCALAAIALTVVGLVPLSYQRRAVAMTAIGLVLLLQGAFGLGPLSGMAAVGTAPHFELFRVAASTLLPASLLFRAHYRAFATARLLLGWGLALALPFLVRSGFLVAWGSDPATRLSAAGTLCAAGLSLVGFMGASTTALGSAWAISFLALSSLDVAARAFTFEGQGEASVFAAITFLVASLVASVGLFQLLSSRFSDEARRIDVHRPA